MGKVKELYMDIENSAAEYLDDYLNNKDLNLSQCRYKFEAEHGCDAMQIFDEIFEGAEILKMNGHK